MIKKKRNPRVLFRNVAYKLSEIEGKTLTETASFSWFWEFRSLQKRPIQMEA
ncbi:hypothetical protein SAG0109_10310 [Streptococcus agalactiae BSU108]|nr:hypothetical protein SAG0109_10310 [Streptococcus agalactiae BSU108]EPW71558.1 hypothetical protein SAG0101_00735 [Streptococcus agalactiae BSU451]